MKLVLILEVGDKVADTVIDKMLDAAEKKEQIGIAVGNIARAPATIVLMRVV